MGGEINYIERILDKLDELEKRVGENAELLSSLNTYIKENGLNSRLRRTEERVDKLYKWLIFGFLGIIVIKIVERLVEVIL